MTTRRGLTLLEVLIATAILTLLTVTCLPLLRESLAVFQWPTDEQQLAHERLQSDLSTVADAFVTDPASFGIKDVRAFVDQQDRTIGWPEKIAGSTEYPSILIHPLRSGQAEIEHAWLEFACGEAQAIRFIALPKPPSAAGSGPASSPKGSQS